MNECVCTGSEVVAYRVDIVLFLAGRVNKAFPVWPDPDTNEIEGPQAHAIYT